MKKIYLVNVILLCLLILPVYAVNANAGSNEIISITQGANGDSWAEAISEDGNLISFMSYASNLVGNDTNNVADVFLYDKRNKTIKRVSVSSTGAEGNNDSSNSKITQDGRFVFFLSYASNLVENDRNGKGDIFRHDLQTDETIRVSFTATGEEISSYGAIGLSISRDGKLVAFTSGWDKIVENDNNKCNDLFIRNIETGEVKRANVSSSGFEANIGVGNFYISGDGRYAVFSSGATNLTAEGGNNYYLRIYKHDFETGETIKIDNSLNGIEENNNSDYPYISFDGRYIMFSSWKTNLVQNDGLGSLDAFVYDNLTKEIAKASLSYDGEDIGYNTRVITPRISDNGRYVSFYSESKNIVPNDTNTTGYYMGGSDVFIRDRTKDLNTRVSVSSEDMEANHNSHNNKMTNNGKFVIFSSRATNLVSDDNNGFVDVFLAKNVLFEEENQNFSFAHITDVHLGSDLILGWREEQSYPRFADTLYSISKLANKPDFILIGGDNVEYAGGESGLRYLRDFKSMIDSFTANTGIEVYVVPGNHDRYERPVLDLPFLTGGDDKLENYHKVMTELPANEILFFNETLNNEISGDGGYNRYNYYFTDKHKGVKFIGMDSGEDNHETMDLLPESEGLSGSHINILENMEYEMPKVVFMHSPVYNDFKMGADLDYWFNGSILHKLPEFLGGFCSVYNTKIILSGHTHQSEIYDLYGNKIEEPAFENTRLATATRPLFIQTPSATVDDSPIIGDDTLHGYRIIDIEDGDIIPRTPSITDFQPKLVADLCIDHGGYFITNLLVSTGEYVEYKDSTCNNNLDFKFFNPWSLDVQYITPQGENVNFPRNASFFTASSSDRLILYDSDFLERSKMEVYNPFSNEERYNLVAHRDNHEIENFFYDDMIGLRINNTKFGIYPFILASSDENQLMILQNIAIQPNSGQKLIINWDVFQGDNGTAGFLLSGDINNNGIIEDDEQVNGSNAQLLPLKYTADLGSPGELRVYNEAGEVSGLAEREIKEDIPYSIYVPEDEKVIIFSDDSENNNYKYEVAGTADDTYDLEVKSEKEGEDAVIFNADDIKTNVGVIHRYTVDWEALKNNENGAIIEIDNDGDGQYEHSANIGAEFSDKSAPFTSILVNDEQVNDSWINTTAKITFYAEDNDGGIGVEKIRYSLDGGLTWLEYSEPFVISDEGIHKIIYRATDYFGNQEEIKSADIKIDMTPPEAKIFVSAGVVDLEIVGMDNLTSVATVRNDDNLYTITDEAGNFIKLNFSKIKEKKKLIQAKVNNIEYSDGAKYFLPKNHLIYTWAMPNNILLNQIIEVKNEFNVSARYDKKSDQTIVKYRDSGNKKIESRFDGLKILEIFTAQGKLNYQF